MLLELECQAISGLAPPHKASSSMRLQSVFAVVVAVLTLAWGMTPPPTSAQTPGVDAPVRALIEAMADGDAARIRAQFSPDATQAYGAEGRMGTPAAAARWLETDIIERNGKVTNPEFTVNGNEVVVRGQYSSRGYSSKADFLFTVENGLITSWRMRY